jgi:hypothetical protein
VSPYRDQPPSTITLEKLPLFWLPERAIEPVDCTHGPPSKQAVQKTALPGLKAAEHGRIENLFRRECPATLDEVVEGRNLVALANLAEDPQRILYRRW